MSDRAEDAVERLLAAFAARRPIRTGSLIVTVFGDAILPRGGEVLLADLLALLEGFSLNHNQVRTALSRLVADGWLAAERRGRHSLYRLTVIGRHRFDEATRRIYAGLSPAWRGGWHVAILPPGGAGARDALRKELGWLGFGTLAPGVMLHPDPDPASLASVIADLAAAERPLVIAGDAQRPVPAHMLHDLVARSWDLDALAEAYRKFLAAFAALHRAVTAGVTPEPLPALLARLALIHDYRRIVLRDPMLPRALLPDDWIGREAYRTAQHIYRALARPAERWIDRNLRNAAGPLPPPDGAFGERFP